MAKEYHIQPSEVERMYFWIYETWLEQMNVIAKKQEEDYAKQQEDMDSMKSAMNPAKIGQAMSGSMGNVGKASSVSMPSIPSISTPTVSMPKISIPKF